MTKNEKQSVLNEVRGALIDIAVWKHDSYGQAGNKEVADDIRGLHAAKYYAYGVAENAVIELLARLDETL